MNFWKKLVKPIFILAPMEGVTDTVFRQIVASVGAPDVFFTEFVPVEALVSRGREKALRTLKYSKSEKPVVAQVWGTDPEKFYKSAQIIKKLGFGGIDINMGCPKKDEVKNGACSALIKNPQLATGIILAAIKGANGLPVSVKTRIGFSQINTGSWVETLLKTPISALILHLRTVSEMSHPPAHWDEISKAVEIRNTLRSKALIIGNGDVKTLIEARDKCKKYGIDGVMIGRGIFENVCLFSGREFTPKQKIKLLIKHLMLFKKTWGDTRHFALMKKFVKCYVNNFEGSSKLREKLMSTKTLEDLIQEANYLN